MQEAYSVTEIKTQIFSWREAAGTSRGRDELGQGALERLRWLMEVGQAITQPSSPRSAFLRKDQVPLLNDYQFICFLFLLDYSKAQKQFSIRVELKIVWASIMAQCTHNQAWLPEFNPQDPQGGRREQAHTSCPLPSTCVVWHMHHTITKCNKK